MPNPNGYTPNLKHYKPKWNSGKTRTIRVPIELAETVLDYAHHIDEFYSPDTSVLGNRIEAAKQTFAYIQSINDVDSFDTSDTSTDKLQTVIEILNEALTLKANAGGAIKQQIRVALSFLE